MDGWMIKCMSEAPLKYVSMKIPKKVSNSPEDVSHLLISLQQKDIPCSEITTAVAIKKWI